MIDLVIDLLVADGYAHVPLPLRVAGVDFGVDAALVGPGGYGNLVVIVRDDGSGSADVVRQVRSLMLVLSRTNSSRPVTVVLLSQVGSASFEPLSELAHVVRIAEGTDEPGIRRSLACLLRLRVPEPITAASTETLFGAEPGPLQSEAICRALTSAARRGDEEVQDTFLRLVVEALTPAKGDDDD